MRQHAGISVEKLQVWNAAVLAALNEPDKVIRLTKICDGLKGAVDICFAAVFVFHRRSAPTCIFDEVEDEGNLSDYVDFAYLLDPIYDRFLAGALPGSCLMRDSAPDDFFSTEYYQKYYGQLGIQDELYFNMIMDEDTLVHVTLTRVNNQTPFTQKELDVLAALEPTVRWIVDDYWQDFAKPHKDSAGQKQKEHDAVSQAFETFGASVLTAREQQIVQLMLKGFSDKSTARILEISPGTVRNHKKNIFGKLEVTSQGQVFGLFLDALASSSSASEVT